MNTPLSLLALSIRQPWAWLIVNNFKPIENRHWFTNFRGEFLIHAGKLPDNGFEEICEDIADYFNIIIPQRLDYGGIIGKATLVDCVEFSWSEWFTGPYGFVLEDSQPLPFYPCRGQLKFFKPEITECLTLF